MEHGTPPEIIGSGPISVSLGRFVADFREFGCSGPMEHHGTGRGLRNLSEVCVASITDVVSSPA